MQEMYVPACFLGEAYKIELSKGLYKDYFDDLKTHAVVPRLIYVQRYCQR